MLALENVPATADAVGPRNNVFTPIATVPLVSVSVLLIVSLSAIEIPDPNLSTVTLSKMVEDEPPITLVPVAPLKTTTPPAGTNAAVLSLLVKLPFITLMLFAAALSVPAVRKILFSKTDDPSVTVVPPLDTYTLFTGIAPPGSSSYPVVTAEAPEPSGT